MGVDYLPPAIDLVAGTAERVAALAAAQAAFDTERAALDAKLKAAERKARVALPGGLRTPREATARLGCSIKTLNGHIASGALPYVAMGHGAKHQRRMFTDADLDAFVASQTRKDSPACLSSRTRVLRSGGSTSKSEVIAFSAQRRPGPAAKRKR